MKPICIVSSDWHIDENNLEEIPGLISQKINLAKKLGVNTLVCLGDVFQSRKAQKESVLNCFKSVLDEIYLNKMTLYTIPGNHDKTDYFSYSSFLDPFYNHPALRLITSTTKVEINGIISYFIPFFEEQIWIKEFDKIQDPYNILFSHIAINGSVNNNKTKVESSITPKLFKEVEVYLGHYHNYQDITSNIHHLPSLKQNNFGETDNKGFTIIYDNCSFEIYNSVFKKYLTYNIHVKNPDFKNLMSKYINLTNNNYVKVKLEGSINDIKGIDLNFYKSSGVKVDTIFDELVIKNQEQVNFSDLKTIIEHFMLFCQDKDINYEDGVDYLKNAING